LLLLQKKKAEKTAADFTAEGLFVKAEHLLNDWFYHIPEIKKILEEVLVVDPGFSRAHTELGLFDLRAFGFEYPERIAEAEIAIKKGDFKEAKVQLDKALKLNSTIVNGFIIKSLVENKLNNNSEALSMLEKAKLLDGENPFTLCTEYLLNKSDVLGKNIKNRYVDLPEELLEVVSVFYRNGFYKEAYSILKRRIKSEPKNGQLYHLLGDFYYGHDLENEGIANWEKSQKLGHKNKIMLMSLYRAQKKLGNKEIAYKYLLAAYKLDKNDPYIFEDYVAEIHKRQGVDKAIKLMLANYNKFDKSYSLKANLMNTYLYNKKYSELEELLLKSNLHDTHRLSFGDFWKNLKMANGYNKLKNNKYEEALADFEISIQPPQNIAQHYIAHFYDQARRLFYMGYCNAKLGNQEKANELWEEALTLRRNSKFSNKYEYWVIKTIYYQAFCLKALGRIDESENYIKIIEEYANSNNIFENVGLRKQLLKLSILGLDDVDNFENWDSELGLIKTNVNFNAPEE